MIGFIFETAILLLGIRLFTGDNRIRWQSIALWVILSYIPPLIIMFINLTTDSHSIFLHILGTISQVGILYYCLNRYYGSTATIKILGMYLIGTLLIEFLL